jgi:hypothetical protein
VERSDTHQQDFETTTMIEYRYAQPILLTHLMKINHHRLQLLLLFLLSTMLSACTTPQKHNAAELLGQKICFKADPEMRLTKAFKPGMTEYKWHLQTLADWREKPDWWDAPPPASPFPFLSEDDPYLTIAAQGIFKVSNTTRVSIDEVGTMWDFENGYRITIFGTAHLPVGDLKFRYLKFGNNPFDPQEVLQSIFQQCN